MSSEVKVDDFKKISIGGIEKEILIQRLENHGIQFNKYAHVLFEDPLFRSDRKPEKVRLAKLTLGEPAIIADIRIAAERLGLQLCPLYLGAYLRLEYMEQPQGPYLTIASEKLSDDEEYPNGFYLRNFENSLWLRGYRASDDYEWPAGSELIFIK